MLAEINARTQEATRPPEIDDFDPIERKEKKKREESEDLLRTRNFTLEFSSGRPDDLWPGITNSPPYATCFVEYQDRSQRGIHGSVEPRNVLEQWVMRGDGDIIESFKQWRGLRNDASMSFRCMTTASNSLKDTTCLECVSHSPSSASVPLPSRIEGTVHSSMVMTFNGLPQCLANVGGLMSFCKSGMVALPM